MYLSPKAELLYPETEVVLADVVETSQMQTDNNFHVSDLV